MTLFSATYTSGPETKAKIPCFPKRKVSTRRRLLNFNPAKRKYNQNDSPRQTPWQLKRQPPVLSWDEQTVPYSRESKVVRSKRECPKFIPQTGAKKFDASKKTTRGEHYHLCPKTRQGASIHTIGSFEHITCATFRTVFSNERKGLTTFLEK